MLRVTILLRSAEQEGIHRAALSSSTIVLLYVCLYVRTRYARRGSLVPAPRYKLSLLLQGSTPHHGVYGHHTHSGRAGTAAACGTTWDHVGPRGTTWDHAGPVGPINQGNQYLWEIHQYLWEIHQYLWEILAARGTMWDQWDHP